MTTQARNSETEQMTMPTYAELASALRALNERGYFDDAGNFLIDRTWEEAGAADGVKEVAVLRSLVERLDTAESLTPLMTPGESEPAVPHSTGRWEVQPLQADHGNSLAIVAAEGFVVAVIVADKETGRLPCDEANAERIVTCVNALDGVPSNVLSARYVMTCQDDIQDGNPAAFWSGTKNDWVELDEATRYAAGEIIGLNPVSRAATWVNEDEAVELVNEYLPEGMQP